MEDESVTFCGESDYDLFLSINETVHGERRHFGWTDAGFDDSAWLKPNVVTNEFPGIVFSELPWSLFPRPIPQLTEIPRRFKSVVQVRRAGKRLSSTDLISEWTGLLRESRPLTILAGQELEIDIEAFEYSTGYLQFAFQDGRNAVVRHLSAESYELTPRKTALEVYVKGHRRDFENGYLNGEWDCTRWPDETMKVTSLSGSVHLNLSDCMSRRTTPPLLSKMSLTGRPTIPSTFAQTSRQARQCYRASGTFHSEL